MRITASILRAVPVVLVVGLLQVALPSEAQLAALNGVVEPHRSLGLRLTVPFTALGGPALSIPCGFSAAGLPIGLQLAGRRFDEAAVLRVGHAYEQSTDWHRRPAPLAD